MRNKIIILSILLISVNSFGQSSNLNKQDSVESKAFFFLRNGGYTFLDVSFNPLWVVGVMKIEENGVLFTPDSVFEKSAYKKVFRFNHLIKSIFIPYSKIKKCKQALYITAFMPVSHATFILKDGTRYRFSVNSKSFYKKLKARLVNQ